MPSPKPTYIVVNYGSSDVEFFHSLEEVRNYLAREIETNSIEEHEVDNEFQVFEMKRQLKIKVELEKKANISLQ